METQPLYPWNVETALKRVPAAADGFIIMSEANNQAPNVLKFWAVCDSWRTPHWLKVVYTLPVLKFECLSVETEAVRSLKCCKVVLFFTFWFWLDVTDVIFSRVFLVHNLSREMTFAKNRSRLVSHSHGRLSCVPTFRMKPLLLSYCHWM